MVCEYNIIARCDDIYMYDEVECLIYYWTLSIIYIIYIYTSHIYMGRFIIQYILLIMIYETHHNLLFKMCVLLKMHRQNVKKTRCYIIK